MNILINLLICIILMNTCIMNVKWRVFFSIHQLWPTATIFLFRLCLLLNWSFIVPDLWAIGNTESLTNPIKPFYFIEINRIKVDLLEYYAYCCVLNISQSYDKFINQWILKSIKLVIKLQFTLKWTTIIGKYFLYLFGLSDGNKEKQV